jgi:hypothetical protein
MDFRPSTASLLRTLERASGGKLSRQNDLGTLLELGNGEELSAILADLSFHAKFVSHAYRLAQRIGTGAEGYDKLSHELNAGIATVTSLTRVLLAHAEEPVRQRFLTTYLETSPESLSNLLALCYDLSWYKNWMLDGERSMPADDKDTKHTGSALWRIALLFCAIAATLWLGSVCVRALVAYDLLQPGTVLLNESLPPDVERNVYHLLASIAIVSMSAYVVVLLSSIVVLAAAPFRLRDHGWMMMSAILLYLFVPVEIYTMILDYRMVHLEFFAEGVNLTQLREIFLARTGALAGAPFIALLCYYTIFGLLIFQPFRRKRTDPA